MATLKYRTSDGTYVAIPALQGPPGPPGPQGPVSGDFLPIVGGTVTGTTTFSNTTASTSTTTGAVKINGGLGVAGAIYSQAVHGAVWNDYAEFRKTVPTVKPGQVVIENGDGSLRLSTKRLERGANIVSDTFGFAIGETEETKTPLAVSGRALAYTYENRDTFAAGEPVCSGPNGTVSRMTDEEARNYPWCIVGTVSEIPSYERWGTGNVEVDGRIWIKVS